MTTVIVDPLLAVDRQLRADQEIHKTWAFAVYYYARRIDVWRRVPYRYRPFWVFPVCNGERLVYVGRIWPHENTCDLMYEPFAAELPRVCPDREWVITLYVKLAEPQYYYSELMK